MASHIICDFNNVTLSKEKCLYESFKDFLDSFRFKSLGFCGHIFDNGGETGVFLLSESHCSYHWWPENKFMSFDLYHCNTLDDMFLEKMIKHLEENIFLFDRSLSILKIIDRKY